VIDQFRANIESEPRSSSSSDSNCSRKVLKLPVAIQVRSFGVGGCHSFVVEMSPMFLLISEVRLTTLLGLVNQCFATFWTSGTTNAEEYLQPQQLAMSDYTFNDIRLCIQSIGLQIFEDANECEIAGSPSLSPHQQLTETISRFITLMSCLDFQCPNQDAIDCSAKLCEDQCTALGLSQEDARNIVDAAKLNYQSELKSELGGSHGENPFSKTTMSRKTMERIIAQATKKATSSFKLINSRYSPLSKETSLFINMEAVSVSLSVSYCRSVVQAKSKSFAIRNGLGVNLFNVRMKPVPVCEDTGAVVVSLSSHQTRRKGTRKDIYLAIESAEVTFDPETYLNALKLCGRLKIALGDVDMSIETSNDDPKVIPASDATVIGTLSSFSVTITDQLIPFARFKFSNLSLKYSMPSEASLLAKSILLQCVSPTGAGTYSDTITTYEPNTKDDCKEQHALAFNISRKSIFSDTNEVTVNVSLDGVRLMLVRQFVNEILQYTSSPDYGLSMFYNNIKQAEVETDDPACHNEQHLTIRISNSSIFLPRDSMSVDIVGIEVNELSVSTLRVSESWSVDSYTFRDSSRSPKRGGHGIESTRSSSSEIFFDCVDDEISTNGTPGNLTETLTASLVPEISRISLKIEGARVFTALNSRRHSPDNVKLSLWNRVVLF